MGHRYIASLLGLFVFGVTAGCAENEDAVFVDEDSSGSPEIPPPAAPVPSVGA